MHYAEYKHRDLSLLREMVETFPFAAVTANGASGPMIALAPLTFREKSPSAAGAIEFHLALANDITASLPPDTHISVLVQGPGAAISPSWYAASFPAAGSDRSQTAPTYNYLSLVLQGRVQWMDDEALQAQIAALVLANEPPDGWRLEELAPNLWTEWRRAIRGYRFEIDHFDLTAKISQGDTAGDRPSIANRLRDRGRLDDQLMAHLVRTYDGTSASLIDAIRDLRLR